nr:MAG TPA: hypothetical protein [Caudoviricetes sp.]
MGNHKEVFTDSQKRSGTGKENNENRIGERV